MITVALPLYKARNVAWLCLESLCNQKTIIDWELIVCEEYDDDMLGAYGLLGYYDRLERAGCVNASYIKLDHWIGLMSKWRKIAHSADKHSVVYQMCAADNYYQPLMLQQSYDRISQGVEWHQSYRCHFYDVNTKKLVLYEKKKYSGVEMAMRMDFAKNIPCSNRKKQIDYKIMRTLNPAIVEWNESEECLKTVCTHGKNLISWNRGVLINVPKYPFSETNYKLSDLLPEYIIDKL